MLFRWLPLDSEFPVLPIFVPPAPAELVVISSLLLELNESGSITVVPLILTAEPFCLGLVLFGKLTTVEKPTVGLTRLTSGNSIKLVPC